MLRVGTPRSAPELVAGKGPGAGPHCQRGPHQPLTSALGHALPPSPEEKHAGIVAFSPAKQQFQICKKPQCSRKGLKLPLQTRDGEAERTVLCFPCMVIFPLKKLHWFPSCLAALWGSPALPILPASQGPAHAPTRLGRDGDAAPAVSPGKGAPASNPGLRERFCYTGSGASYAVQPPFLGGLWLLPPNQSVTRSRNQPDQLKNPG